MKLYIEKMPADVSSGELRILLLGNREAGKSSTGNTILSREEFNVEKRTVQCVKRQGEVAGRQVTVVEVPGWRKNVNLKDTPELTKEEIVLSVSLCPPGPHAVLVVIRVDYSVTEEQTANIQQYLELLGERVWSHTMVLFTCGDWLGDTIIEQHIESEGALQSLVEKCGNRYHVFNNENRSDMTQITQLLEKIEEMVAGNSGHHFEMDRERLEEVMEKREKKEKRVKERLIQVEKQRQHLQSLKREFPPLSDIRVVLLGYRTAGKRSSGNTILGREEFDLRRRTAQCVKRQGKVAGRHVTIVKAVGWRDNFNITDTPELTKEEIVLSMSLCPPGPHAVLLVIRLDYSVSEKERSNIQQHLELLSERVWSHTMVLFTCGDCLEDTTIEQHIESEGALHSLMEKCGKRYHVLNNNNRSDKTQVTLLLEKIEDMVADNMGYCFQMDRKRLGEIEEKREQQKQQAEDRQMSVYRQRETFRFVVGGLPHLSEMRIVLLGCRGSGKSSSGNIILGREAFHPEQRSVVCLKQKGEVAGRQITVVEAPGWQINETFEDTPEHTKKEIVRSVSLCPPGPHAILLVIPVCTAFTERQNETVLVKLPSKRVWNHTMVLFTYGDWLGDTPIEQHIESEGETLQWIIGKCGNRYHVLNNNDWTDRTQVTELLEKIEEMVVRNGGAHYDRRQKEPTLKSFLTGALRQNKEDDQKREMDEAGKRPSVLDLESMNFPPDLSGDDRSELLTEDGSAYKTLPSPIPPKAPLEHNLKESINTVSSGIGSVSSEKPGIVGAQEKTGEESAILELKVNVKTSKVTMWKEMDP